MAVKDLVTLYEPDPSRSRLLTASLEPPRDSLHPEAAAGLPAGSLVQHPLLRRREPSQADDDDTVLDDGAKSTSPLLAKDTFEEDTTSTTLSVPLSETAARPVRSEPRVKAWTDRTQKSVDPAHDYEMKPLASSSATYAYEYPTIHTTPSFVQSEAMDYASSVTSSTAAQSLGFPFLSRPSSQPNGTSHTPIPATEIFARKGAPLYLPGLDNYLSSLPANPLAVTESRAGSSAPMFSPMDRLKASGRSLGDLEHNATVAPGWRNRNSILSTLTSLVLGIVGSSAIASLYSIQGPIDFLQVFALILSTFKSGASTSSLETLFLDTIPNVLALNIVSQLLPSVAVLVGAMCITGGVLYYFYRATSQVNETVVPEGLKRIEYPKNSWLVVLAVFFLTLVYLPLSTLAVHVLVWSDDLWAVSNPYINATTNPPVVAPLGPAEDYRDPLNFCYTTTMEINQINYAPAIIIVAIVSFLFLTLWYPIGLYRATTKATPVVDLYTEFGVKRNGTELNREYQRLLLRDRNPLSFLYNGFRRGWGTYESVFLLAKLTTLLITAVITPYNCIFRSLPQTAVKVARQITLVVAMLVFFILQCVFSPFLDPVNNASEVTSRLNYLLTSALSLAVVLDVPGEGILDGPVLYVIYGVTYGLAIYFTAINWNFMRRFVKRMARRVDFSVDLFSPRLDLSPSSPHTRRRIWQEAITTLFLTTPECAIPKTQKMQFKESRTSEFPPYLADFAGTCGERLVENIKILREVGGSVYTKAVVLLTGPESSRFRQLERAIQSHFVGPDCYWKPSDAPIPKCSNFFGNAWWIPFPPTLVIQYDEGPLAVVQGVAELEQYVAQNSSPAIQRKREIRVALRALDGQVVTWPYDCERLVGNNDLWCCFRKRYGARTVVHYRSGVLHLKRRGSMLFEGTDLGSGFQIQLVYAKDVQVDGSEIGLTDDIDLTRALAHFLSLNERLIMAKMGSVESVLQAYREQCRKECQWKKDTLTYSFLMTVWDRPQSAAEVADQVLSLEHDAAVRRLVISSQAAIDTTFERWCVVSRSEITTWWYIFWDDIWRRNYDTISGLQKYESDFNPYYASSIAYTPLPRPALEAFLIQRGLLHKTAKWGDFFDTGFLNKVYLRLNDIAFHGTDGAMLLHLGDNTSELDMEGIDAETLTRPSTLGTGPGTDYDDVSIRARPMYRWEGIFEDSLSKGPRKHRDFLSKLGVWFGVTPLWRAGLASQGFAVDVRLDNGRYVLLEDSHTRTGRHVQNGNTKLV